MKNQFDSVASLAIWAMLCGGLMLHPAIASAVTDASVSRCSTVEDDAGRLKCYDDAFRQLGGNTVSKQVATDSITFKRSLNLDAVAVSPMSSHWELTKETKNGAFSFKPHRPNYLLLGRVTDSVNRSVYEPYFASVSDKDLGIDKGEAKFQLSFKLKAIEDVFGGYGDLWFGYTQQNNWQVGNSKISAPFRETNYEPELFVTLPHGYNVLGLTGRFINLGFSHQSNGQSYVLSRSWNRLYAQFGFEYGDNFNLMVKPWYRIKEKTEQDDNPDITNYLGNLEVVANYRIGKQSFTALARSTTKLDRGFAQLDWSFPLADKLKGYVQITSGYGESLIDFNHRQNTIGIGFMLTDWQ